MSRPRPTVLLEWVDPRTFKSEQILKADSIYAVFYNNLPINMRSINKLVDYPGPKYRKTSFSNPGHAFNLSEKLNKMFKTDLFTVHELSAGKQVLEKDILSSYQISKKQNSK